MKHYLTQFRGFRIPGRKTLPANFTQRADKGVAVLAADFAILDVRRDLVCSCCSPDVAAPNRADCP